MGDQRPIIIKRKKAGHGGHHGGAWKVAFADFMTAMMAFFLVMWIVGLSESSRKAIAGYFREPGIFSFTTGKALPEKIEVTPRSERNGDGSGGTGKANHDVVLTVQRSCGGPSTSETGKMSSLKGEVSKQLEQLAQKRPDLAKLASSIEVTVTDEGLRIELSETKDIAYFEVGGARPSKAANEVLAAIAPALAAMDNLVVVEGHTDTRAYPKGATYTNWELSADRANAARKLLLESGLAPKKFASVTGYADTRLRNKDNAYDISNRRVSVVVKYKEQPPVPAPAAPGAVPPIVPAAAPPAAHPAVEEKPDPEEKQGRAEPPRAEPAKLLVNIAPDLHPTETASATH